MLVPAWWLPPPRRSSGDARHPGIGRWTIRDAQAGRHAIRSDTFVFKVVDGCPLQADVYRPADERSRPTLVWLHGGAPIMGSRAGLDPVQRDRYLAAGFAGVALDYRLAPETRLPAIVEDIRDAFAENLNTIRAFAHEEGRELSPTFAACLYYNINVNEDRDAAFAESKKFLDAYYGVTYTRPMLERWVAFGSPQECIEQLRSFVAAGATTITLRLTGYDQERQFERVTNEVLPAFA